MLRALWLFLVVAAVTVGALWLSTREGLVTIEVPGMEYKLSLAAALFLLLLAIAASIFVYRFFSWLGLLPNQIAEWGDRRRRKRGVLALTKGLVAAAAGDGEDARRQSRLALNLVGEPPLALLLAAQSAQLDGDEKGAEKYFQAMLASPEMEFLGLRGLYMAALRKGDRDRAQDLAARAYALRPKAPWVVNALFELRTQSADWGAAGQTLDAMGKAKLLDPGVTKRRRAVLRAAQAMQAEMAGDQQQALAFAQEAVGIAPGLTAAALLAAKRLAGLGRTWKASAILEQAWAKEPHPEIARAYAALKPDEAQRARSVRLAGLAGQNADHPESRILSASLALANGDWRAAKETMRPLSGSFPSARMCTLMADIERMAGDEAESRGWSARAIKAQRDAVWACASCARQYPDWSALCPGCEAFDSLTWLSGAADKVSKLPEGGLSGAQADMGDLDLALYRAAVKRAPDVGPAPAPRPQQPVDTVVEAPPQAAAVPDIVRPPLPDDPGPDAADWDDADAAARRKGAGW